MVEGVAKSTLKSLMRDRDIGSSDLAVLVSDDRFVETKSSIDSKISRGSFSADFFLRCLKAMNVTEIALETIVDTEQLVNDAGYPVESQPKRFRDSRTGNHYLRCDDVELNSKPTVVSLFSGAGGFDIGLEQAGFQTLACIDFDKDCRKTLEFNRPDWMVVDGEKYQKQFGTADRVGGDIRSISPQEVLDALDLSVGDVDLVVGGAPCQPFSNMGKKAGKSDETNGDLFLHFVRYVRDLKPKAFIFENVVGITQSRHREVISYMEDQFAGMQFGISHAVLNAANYGVPQRRERFFLIGIRGTDRPAFPLPTHFKSEESWSTFTGSFDIQPQTTPLPWKTVGQALKKIPKTRRSKNDYVSMGVSDVVANRMTYVKAGQNFKVVPPEFLPNCWKSGKHMGSDTFGRLDPNQPSVTIRTAAYNPSKGRYIHPYEDRGLDTVEMAALQDFPPSWQFRCTARERVTLVSAGKQIGNAVPPGLAKAIGLAIKEQMLAGSNPE
ncbi:MAG: DNA (cytosine-5-)-methyltransferase [Sulfitobacter sp.]|jgi:DNA (cytosine-5)-methyltransferase 1